MPWGSDRDYVTHSNVLHPSLQKQLSQQDFNCYAERQVLMRGHFLLFNLKTRAILIIAISTTTLKFKSFIVYTSHLYLYYTIYTRTQPLPLIGPSK